MPTTLDLHSLDHQEASASSKHQINCTKNGVQTINLWLNSYSRDQTSAKLISITIYTVLLCFYPKSRCAGAMVSALLSGGKGSKFESWVQLTSRSGHFRVQSLFSVVRILNATFFLCLARCRSHVLISFASGEAILLLRALLLTGCGRRIHLNAVLVDVLLTKLWRAASTLPIQISDRGFLQFNSPGRKSIP